ncbi:hypothetical protein [Metabacillus arenae]|uniref:Uncharacterized protein n=1 Tax=Metabacillus arenae TaxID=2771434 RepID=A0A926NCX8_9BACI|nr:hypothetical protein [Metabacillus arenae]MBD1379239.1 hypothetical protein [Metabacillus arenae]
MSFFKTSSEVRTLFKRADQVSITEFDHLKVSVSEGYDWEPAIQQACNSLPNGGTVLIPNHSEFFDFYSPITVPKNVDLLGTGGILRRRFNRTVASQSVRLEGNNKISFLKYDGGFDVIAPGAGENVYYQDFAPQDQVDGDYLFTGCTFSNSCGSFIVATGGSYVKVVGNHFIDWYDHCVYFAGRGVNDTDRYNKDIVVSGNTFRATKASTTRSAVKARNGVYNYSITGNTLDMATATFAEVGSGDSGEQRENENIAISGNAGICSTFVSIGYSGTTGLDVPVERVNITGNAVECIEGMFEMGSLPSSSVSTLPDSQRGVHVKSLIISNNSLKGKGFLVNGQISANHDGIETFTMNGNDMEIVSTNYVLFPMGNISKLNFKNNTVSFLDQTSGAQIISMYRQSTYLNYNASIVGEWTLEGNLLLKGAGKYVYENSAGKTETAFTFNLYLINNRIDNDSTGKRLVQVVGDHKDTVTTTIVAKDNKFIGGTNQASDWKTDKTGLIEENEKQKILTSPNGTVYKITVDDTGVVTGALYTA